MKPRFILADGYAAILQVTQTAPCKDRRHERRELVLAGSSTYVLLAAKHGVSHKSVMFCGPASSLMPPFNCRSIGLETSDVIWANKPPRPVFGLRTWKPMSARGAFPGIAPAHSIGFTRFPRSLNTRNQLGRDAGSTLFSVAICTSVRQLAHGALRAAQNRTYNGLKKIWATNETAVITKRSPQSTGRAPTRRPRGTS
jgi:hypothetical protein